MSALDQRFVPMLAVSGELPADDEQWAFEVKWDGVRAITYVQDGALRMESRNLLDITPRYPEVHGLTEAVRGVGAVLDGEVVTFDEQGRPSFQLLQSRMHVQGARDVQRLMAKQPVVYVVFDVLWLAGRPTVALPYTERRRLLDRLDLDGPAWRVSTHHVGDGPTMAAASKERGLEGVMAKRLDSTYEPGRRSRAWVKVKNVRRQEVVIGGWLEGTRNREGRIGALLVGYYDDGVLRFAGKVGTGYTDRTLEELAGTLAPLARDTSPFGAKVPYKQPHFVEPVLVCEVEFTEWTAGGTLRHPSYKGLRDDKRPQDVVREP
jgi:bifunctional non-homologous end joining protein LigD